VIPILDEDSFEIIFFQQTDSANLGEAWTRFNPQRKNSSVAIPTANFAGLAGFDTGFPLDRSMRFFIPIWKQKDAGGSYYELKKRKTFLISSRTKDQNGDGSGAFRLKSMISFDISWPGFAEG